MGGGDEFLTEKDILLELRDDMKRANESLAVLTSQNLDTRVNALEEWKNKASGALTFLKIGVSITAGLVTILIGIVSVLAFNEPK